VEKLFGHGNGAAKKQAASAAIGDLVNIFGQLGNGASAGDSSTMKFVDSLIEATVDLFNNNGTFTHKG
jgi:hypothetical protein